MCCLILGMEEQICPIFYWQHKHYLWESLKHVQQFTVSFIGCAEKSEGDPHICSEQDAGDAGQKDVLVHITAKMLGRPHSCFLSEEHRRMLDKQVPVRPQALRSSRRSTVCCAAVNGIRKLLIISNRNTCFYLQLFIHRSNLAVSQNKQKVVAGSDLYINNRNQFTQILKLLENFPLRLIAAFIPHLQ